MKKQRNLSLILFVVICMSFIIFPRENVFAKNDINLLVRGEVSEGDIFFKDDRTFVPLGLIAENLGYDVNYDNKTKEIKIKNEDKVILMNIGKKDYKLNNKNKSMDVTPVLKNDITYIPIRFIAESFEEKVAWDNVNRVVIISEYSKINTDSKEQTEYTIDGFKFTLDTDNLKNDIGIDVSDNSIRFYDLYNKNKSSDDSSGNLCIINRSSTPDFLVAPSIVLDFDGENYVQAIFETGVEYSTEKNIYKEKYDESMKLLREGLKTYKNTN